MCTHVHVHTHALPGTHSGAGGSVARGTARCRPALLVWALGGER